MPRYGTETEGFVRAITGRPRRQVTKAAWIQTTPAAPLVCEIVPKLKVPALPGRSGSASLATGRGDICADDADGQLRGRASTAHPSANRLAFVLSTLL